MRYKVLITAPYMQPVVERFRSIFAENNIEIIVPPVEERLEEADLIPIIEGVHGVICGDDRFTENVLSKAKDLKVISKWGTGIDSIDKVACKNYNVTICNTLNAFTEPVADTILGYILCFARNLPWMDEEMKSGEWFKIPSFSLREKKVGVIGFGNIGTAVSKRASSFGMKILATDIRSDLNHEAISQYGVSMVDKPTLVRDADFICLACDLNPTSYHVVDEKEFSLMKPTSFVINAARGPLVNEKALIAALQNKKIAGAAMDVFEHEPLPKDSPLMKMNNVMLAPHNANSSPMAWERVHENTINNLIRCLKG